MSLSGFAAAYWLLLLVPVAALAAGYAWMLGRRRRHVLRFTRVELLDRIVPQQPGRRRHVPAAVLAVALVCLVVGLAGPTADARVPRNRAVVMLVIDVSLSMECTDVTPTRLAAAQDAASGFARQLTPGINLGLESFAGAATVLVPPTTDRAPVVAQIQTLKLAESTATGDALAAALGAVANFEAGTPGGDGGPAPATIVLMSDGKQTIGRDEFLVAQQARQAGVPISTISFGTPYGFIELAGTEVPVPVDDASLQRVAQLSGGQFFSARSNRDLHSVYDTLREQIGYETVHKDVSWAWFVLGTLGALVAAGAGLVLTQRVPA